MHVDKDKDQERPARIETAKPPRSWTATMPAEEVRQSYAWYDSPALAKYRRG